MLPPDPSHPIVGLLLLELGALVVGREHPLDRVAHMERLEGRARPEHERDLGADLLVRVDHRLAADALALGVVPRADADLSPLLLEARKLGLLLGR